MNGIDAAFNCSHKNVPSLWNLYQMELNFQDAFKQAGTVAAAAAAATTTTAAPTQV